jgi:AraC-like DNA-binding protein
MTGIERSFFRDKGDFALGCTDMRSVMNRPIETGYNLMLICTHGSAAIEIYGKSEKLHPGDILNAYWEMQLQITSVSDDFEVFYFLMSEDFCNEIYKHLSAALCDMSYEYAIWHTERSQFEQLQAWIQQMLWLNDNTAGSQRARLMRNGVESLFLVCDYESEQLLARKTKTVMSREWNLTVQFGQLLMRHAKAEHQVGFYADKLCITPYYLGTITRQTLNASPKTIIDRDIIRHLKTMLTTTDKSLNEIAEEMHFDDTSYMCKFFRKHTGMKMLEYRNR